MERSKSLDHVREVIRTSHLSYSTEKSYIDWIHRYLIFHSNREPGEMGGKEIREFITDLAIKRKVSPSTQNQALNALVFLYKKVLKIQLQDLDFKNSKIEKHLPVIFSREEVNKVLSNLKGEFHLMASLLYGSGLRLGECLELRIKNIDFELDAIIISDNKGENDRSTLLPHLLIPLLKRQIEKARIKFEENMMVPDFEGTYISEVLETKYPDAPKDQAWQYIFPSRNLKADPRSGKLKQYFHHESYLQKAVKDAVKKVQITKSASCHSFRHSFAVHLLEDGYDIHTIQKLLGHKNVRSTLIYTHLLGRNRFNVRSPLDT